MTPHTLSVRSLLRRCLLLGAVALALPGCGGNDAASAESAVAIPPGQQAEADRGKPCPRQVGALLESLKALRGELAAGLSYEQYAARVEALGNAYDEIPVDRLTIDCLATAGTPSERALNRYIDGANAWGECLADASCDTAAIEPVLQRHWRLAAHFLADAR